jgi:hypothetical protein
MVLLLLAVGSIARWLATFRGDWFLILEFSKIMVDVSPGAVVVAGVMSVLLAPITEEIFWRGYVLAQLRKAMHWSIALLIQSLLFTLAHYPEHSLWLPAIFVYGTILGIWRIRFRSLLPIVLAHIVVNGVFLAPGLTSQYQAAVKSYPKCRQIDALTREPVEKAVPAIIGFFADPDDVVSGYAVEVLTSRYRSVAEPHLKLALASGDKRTVDKALFVVEFYHYPGLKPDVRKLAWSFADRFIQFSATMALHGIKDEEGLRDIAARHPDEKVRQVATDMLRMLRDEKSQ